MVDLGRGNDGRRVGRAQVSGRIREPRPNGHPERYDRWLDVPLFLALRAVKP